MINLFKKIIAKLGTKPTLVKPVVNDNRTFKEKLLNDIIPRIEEM